MTENQFRDTGCDNHQAKLTFKNGSTEFGVITTFFRKKNEERNYYLVKSVDLTKFNNYDPITNEEDIREIAIQINLDDLDDATLLNPPTQF